MSFLNLIALSPDGMKFPAEKRRFLVSMSGNTYGKAEHYVVDWVDTQTLDEGSREFKNRKDVTDFLKKKFNLFPAPYNEDIQKIVKKELKKEVKEVKEEISKQSEKIKELKKLKPSK